MNTLVTLYTFRHVRQIFVHQKKSGVDRCYDLEAVVKNDLEEDR